MDLDEYLLTLDDSKCWLAEEDEVLKKAPSKEDLGIKYLLKRKGYDRVKRRVKYLNIDLPFEV